jgi:hypothetical protein
MTLSADDSRLFGRSVRAPRVRSADSRPALDDETTQVLAYYFPQWHVDHRNEALFHAGWTEWEVLRSATPRFPGHHQPRVPAWGEYDESDPAVASRAVAAALDHGVDGFIIDWYWYDNQPFLNRYLDEGLLRSDRLDEFTFGLMWANHEWTELYPANHGNPTTLFPAPSGRYHAENAFDHILENYLKHPSYLKVGGAPYFSIYDLPGLVKGMGGVAETAELLERFRSRAAAAGIPDLHLNAVINPTIADPGHLVDDLGFDSATHYTWWHHPDQVSNFPTTEYSQVAADAVRTWPEMAEVLPVPYFPNVSVGWDPSPRTVEWEMDRDAGYPFTTILTGGTAGAFGTAVVDALNFVETQPSPRVVTINAWNEWTEGSYLEPDTVSGFDYLEAIATARAGMASS